MSDVDLSPPVIKAQLERGLQYLTKPDPASRDKVFGECNASLYYMRNDDKPAPQEQFSALAAVVHFIQNEDSLDAEFRAELIQHVEAGITACG